MTLGFLAIAFAVVYFMYRSNQTTALVASEYQSPVPDDGIQAIEYFWRPG